MRATSVSGAVRESSVVAMTDNTTAVGFLKNQGGTHSLVLTDLTRQLLDGTRENRVTLSARYISVHLITRADRVGRADLLFPGEWLLKFQVCVRLWQLWGRPMVDLFATRENNRRLLFVSPMPDVLSIRTDGLSQPWDGMIVYAYPPTSLMSCVLKKLEASKDVKPFLVAPNWAGQVWFPD